MKIVTLKINGNSFRQEHICCNCGKLFLPHEHPTHCGRCSTLFRRLPEANFAVPVTPMHCRDTQQDHALYAHHYDIRGEPLSDTHVFLDGHISRGGWVLTVEVEVSHPNDLALQPDPRQKLLILPGNKIFRADAYTFWVQKAIASTQMAIDEALAEINTLLNGVKEQQIQRFLTWLGDRKAFCMEDVPAKLWTEAVEASLSTWKEIVVRERFVRLLFSTIRYEPSSPGLTDYLARISNRHPSHRARIDEGSNTLYVAPGYKGWWIGSQGTTIKALSAIWGERLQVKEEEQRVSVSV